MSGSSPPDCQQITFLHLSLAVSSFRHPPLSILSIYLLSTPLITTLSLDVIRDRHSSWFVEMR